MAIIDAARPRKFRSLRAVGADAETQECFEIYREIGRLAERGRRVGIDVADWRSVLHRALHVGGQAAKAAETANAKSIALFAGASGPGGDMEDSWAVGWIFPRGTSESDAADWLANVENVDMEATPQAAYSPTGRWFHGAVWFERRPSGRLFARQSGALDT